MGKLSAFVVPKLIAVVGWLYYYMPPLFRQAAGRGLGFCLRVSKLRSKVIIDNLNIGYPGGPKHRTDKLFNSSYEHLGHLSLEIMMLLGPMKKFVSKWVDLTGVKHWREAKEAGRGVIFLASHVGNWEIMAASGGVQAGIDIMLVTKHLQPEWLHQAIEQGRAKCGVRATYEPRTLRDVLSHLKKNGTVGFVLDQYAGPPVGVRVPFFGVPVGTNAVIATLVRRTGAVLLPVVNHRERDGRIKVEIGEPLQWISETQTEKTLDEEQLTNLEIAKNTAHYACVLEKHVRLYAEQWLWIHRRFKGDLSPLKESEWQQGRARQ